MKLGIDIRRMGPTEVGIMVTVAHGPVTMTNFNCLCVKEAEDLAQQILQVAQEIRLDAKKLVVPATEVPKPTLTLVKGGEPNTGTPNE